MGSKTASRVSIEVGDVIKVGEDIYVIPISQVIILVNVTFPWLLSGMETRLSLMGLGIPLAFLVICGERIGILPLASGYSPSLEVASSVVDSIERFSSTIQ